MAAIAGVAQAERQHSVSAMIARIAHRGGECAKTITTPQVTMGASWASLETRPVSGVLQHAAIWDGVPVQSPRPETFGGWTQPFALAAVSCCGLFLARGPLGVRPLYYGHTEDGALAFASEVRAVLAVTDDVREFPPGTWYTPVEGFQPYAHVEGTRLPHEDPDCIASELRTRLERAVARCVVSDRMGTWLSGGVDSSVIATLARPHVRTFHSFVSGVRGAPDLDYGRQMAMFLGTIHHSLVLGRDDLVAALPDVIYHLESFDALLVRSAVVNYLTAQLASGFVDAVFSGEGGDELFAGYDYIKGMPVEKVPDELVDLVMRLHNTAFQRVDRCAHAHGLVPFVPFADLDAVQYALSIPSRYKLRQHRADVIEKWILRRAFRGLLPDTMLWRPKVKFWQGAGVETLLVEHAEASVTDADFRRERVLSNGWQLRSKEELVYYRIFRECFGKIRNLDWMGRTKRVPEKGCRSLEERPPYPAERDGSDRREGLDHAPGHGQSG